MPKVPQYQVGQVQSQAVSARQQINAPADAFGAGVAKATIGAGQDLGKVAKESMTLAGQLQDRHDKAVLRESDNKGQEFLRETLTSFQQHKGRDALDNQEEAEDRIRSYFKGVSENLSPRIQGAWGDTSSVRINSALGKVSSYAMSEFVSWENETSVARVELFVNQAADNAGDPKQIAVALGAGIEEIKEMAARGGWSKDQLELKTKEFTSETHKAVIERFLSSDQPSRAELYYKSLPKDAILGTVKDDLENAMLKNGLKKRSQRAADTIMTTVDKNGEPLSETEAMKKAREIETGPLREAVVALVKSRFTENATIRTRYERDQRQSAWKDIIDGKKVTELTADQTSSLTGPILTAMWKFSEVQASGQDPVTDLRKWTDLNAMYYKAAAGDKKARDKLVNMDMHTEYVNALSKTDFDKALAMQGNLMTGKGAASGDSTKTLNRVLNNKAAVDQALTVLFNKRKPGDLTASQNVFKAWVITELGRRLELYAEEQGIKTVPDDVRNKIIYNLTSTWTKENFAIDDIYNLKDIPRDDRDDIVRRREAAGKPIDAASIIQDYLIAQGRL